MLAWSISFLIFINQISFFTYLFSQYSKLIFVPKLYCSDASVCISYHYERSVAQWVRCGVRSWPGELVTNVGGEGSIPARDNGFYPLICEL